MSQKALLDLRDALAFRRTCGIFDDFYSYTDAQLWTKLAADVGASVAVDTTERSGRIKLTTGATNNNEVGVATTNKNFLIASGFSQLFEARLQYAEAATNAANVAVGLFSAATSNLLVDDGAGPATNFSGALIYKVDGGTTWHAIYSDGTTQATKDTGITAGGTADVVLRIEMKAVSSTIVEVTFWINDAIALDTNNNPPSRAIKFSGTYASAAVMNCGVYLKDGSGTGEVLDVDYLAAYENRF